MTEADMKAKLVQMREGRLPEEDLPELLHEFGEADFREAEPEVTRFLRHPNPILRYEAINVLALHWVLPQYSEELRHMLEKDADPNVRRIAVTGLGVLREGTRDKAVARVLLEKLRDRSEHRGLREAAYEALLAVVVPTDTELSARAKASLELLESKTREQEEKTRKQIAAGMPASASYAEFDESWETWVDWGLVERITQDSN
jgi:HEAT repeat protein